MSEWIIGIDIGGTSIKFGFFTSDGNLFFKWDIPTRTEENGKFIIEDLWNSLEEKMREQSMKREHILGIGVGIPGYVNPKTGFVYEAINLGWKDISIKEKLNQKTTIPIFLENDANIAALGENWKGAGEFAKHLIAVTLGTGVGGGIISNGTIINGANGIGGELGHIHVANNGIRCNCGNFGCLETVASATGIVRQAREMIQEYPHSLLHTKYKKTGNITAEDVFQCAEQEDQAALTIVNYTAKILGRTFANLTVVVNPEKILIGGGVSKAGPFLIDKIKLAFEERALQQVKKYCEIKQAKLGNDAGIFGGAFLVKQNMVGVSF